MIAVCLGSVQTATAKTPELAASLPESTAICLRIDDLPARYQEVVDSGLKQRVEKFLPYQNWRQSKDFGKLRQLSFAIETLTGKPVWEVTQQLFGESVIVGLIPSRKNGEDDVLILVTRAESSQILSELLDKWNKAERAELRSHAFKGQKYLERKASGATTFYAIDDRDFVFSSNELGIQASLMAKSSHRNLVSQSWYEKAQEHFEASTDIRISLNPRSFDQKIDWNDDLFNVFPELKEFWNHATAMTLGIRLTDGIVADLHVTELSSDSGTETSSPKSSRTKTDVQIPADALISIEGHSDFGWFGQKLLKLLHKKSAREANDIRRVARGLLLGRGLFDDVLPALGDQWSLRILPDHSANTKTIPIDAVLAIEVDSPDAHNKTGQTGVVDAIENLGHFLVNLLATAANAEWKLPTPAVVAVSKSTATRTVWCEGLRGWSPGFEISDDGLLLFSDSGLLNSPKFEKTSPNRTMPKTSTTPTPTNQKLLQHVRSDYAPHTTHFWAWVDFGAIEHFIDIARPRIVDQTTQNIEDATERDKQTTHILRKMNRFQQVVRLFDAGFANHAVTDERTHFSFGLVINQSE